MANAKSPTPQQLTARRLAVGHTQAQAAETIYLSSYQAWQRFELGTRDCHPAFFELYCLKTAHLLPENKSKPRTRKKS
jgi:putative transcriptional regulator